MSKTICYLKLELNSYGLPNISYEEKVKSITEDLLFFSVYNINLRPYAPSTTFSSFNKAEKSAYNPIFVKPKNS
jgi:hypothetical protein